MQYSLIFENFLNWIDINFAFSLFLFFVFIFFYSFFSLPGLILCLVFAGYAFGFYWAVLVCLISFNIGCLCFFIISKLLLKRFFKKYYDKYTKQIHKFIKGSTLEYLIIFRLIPGPPLLIQNILLSLLEIPSTKFILATVIGSSPIMIFCILIGNKLNNIVNLNSFNSSDIFTWDLLLILFFIILMLLIRILYKKKPPINR